MRIIISPAKKMNADTDTLPYRDLPAFLPKTQQLLDRLRAMNEDELKRLWKCNDQIAQLNMDRLRGMDLHKNLTPAIIAYEGIQYRYMASDVFTHREYDYVQERLRILSGFYGALRPMDGVTPYRLEMQAKLRMGEAKDLYAFWGDELARSVLDGTDCVINLASREYSICISKYLPGDKKMITCVFGEENDGKIIEKGTMCKMARGEMVRFMAAHGIENPEEIKAFEGLDYRYEETYSDAQTYVFVRRKKEKLPEFE
ncbi:MAG: peroxide stress protein YaaA [Clostridia bacterium]|nr:peroxide stress protein YaaA [Clostridia bacterium]MBQ4609152.1 peroxide stress protein YaaA [Clostridia bacterium]